MWLIVAFLIFTLYFYLTRNYNYWKIQNIPYAPNAIPGFGHALPLFLVWDNMPMWVERLYKRMGRSSMYGCYFMQTPALVIRDPELIKSVLQTNFSSFRNNMITLNKNLDPILSNNPFFAKDELWKETRTILGSNFSGKTLRSVFTITVGVCEKFTRFVDKNVCELSGNAEFELKELFTRITGELVANAAFGIEGQSFEDQPDQRAFTNVAKRLFDTTKMNGIEQAMRFCFPNFADVLGLSLIPKETDTYFRENIRTVIKSRLESQKNCGDFLQNILDRMNEIDEDMAVAQATSLFFDGYETSSSVLSFVIYRLAENPRIQQKARAEVNEVFRRHNHELTYEAVKSMNYLEWIMYEAMRLNPGLGELAKTCNEEITLQGYDKLTCRLKPGDVVLVSCMGLHKDEEFWSNPDAFDPDRFGPNKLERNKYTYLGFGEGSRMCIGKRLGTMTVKTVMAVILKNYLLETSPRTQLPLEMDPNTFAWVAKGGLWVRFKPIK